MVRLASLIIMKVTATLLLLALRTTESQPDVCSSAYDGDNDGTCIPPVVDEPRIPDDFVDPCTDDEPSCQSWAREGECRLNPTYMLRACARSCGICQSLRKKSGEEEEVEEEPVCINKYEECDEWANEDGECWVNPSFMLENCKNSCWECVDSEMDRKTGVDESVIAKKLTYYSFMHVGKHQLVRPISDDVKHPMSTKDQDQVRSTIQKMEHYAKHFISDPSSSSRVDTKTRVRCRNEFQMCAEWASRGLCHYAGHYDDNNDDNGSAEKHDILFMMNVCPLACRMCHELDSFHKCAGRRHPNAAALFETGGELTSFLAKSIAGNVDDGGWTVYDPLVVSNPNVSKKDDPYVIVLMNFLSDDEVTHLYTLANAMMIETASTTSNENAILGYHVTGDDQCAGDEVYERVRLRIATLVNSSVSHLEPMDVVRVPYSTAQQQNDKDGSIPPLRHNFEVNGLWKPAGPRVLSLSVFLSDFDDEGQGGGVGFPDLDWLHIRRRKGIAIMWPNVKSDNLWEPDPLTRHEFFPIELPKNVNGDERVFVATFHMRMYNWTDADIRGCA